MSICVVNSDGIWVLGLFNCFLFSLDRKTGLWHEVQFMACEASDNASLYPTL